MNYELTSGYTYMYLQCTYYICEYSLPCKKNEAKGKSGNLSFRTSFDEPLNSTYKSGMVGNGTAVIKGH